MSPSITSDATQSYPQRMTVAKRREASELRKTLKPLMEKRRRARINESLDHLKALILPLIGKDNSRYSKYEKADILEMTVRFLRDLPAAPVKSPAESYKEGYKACLQRVSTMLPKTNLLDKDTCQRVNEYIQQSMSAVEAPACHNCSAQSSRAFPHANQRVPSFKCAGSSRSETHSNNNGLPLNRPQPVPQALTANMWRPW
ncbi:transcription factor HES-2-like [Megalops cyprinoides]|uniref:transcription factor HES-2-like n=1 Tax=Megalops cyprinoides TaxID=118141 RepID=UPI0018648673|nr:transcription factor HES-2-like [Megalops cyprinoides]